MKALIKTAKGPNGIGLYERPIPEPEAGELLVRVHAAGICGTDVHILRDEYDANPPVIMGHEYSGVVAALGEGVKNFAQGDRVVSLTSARVCASCEYCHNDLRMLCNERKSIGSGVDGAFAEYLRIPADLAFRIPENVSLNDAALAEPLACVVRSVIERSPIRAGDRVCVSGPGAIGLLTLQVAKACGASVTVTGTDADIQRLELARLLGADHTVNVAAQDFDLHTAQITGGGGYDIVYECAGAEPSAKSCLRAVKKAGHYQQVGLFGHSIPFDMDLALLKEVTISNSIATERSSWKIALRLMESGKINLSPLVSACFPLERWEEAFRMVLNKQAYKVLLIPAMQS